MSLRRRSLAQGQHRFPYSNRCETRKCSRYNTTAELIWMKFAAFKREKLNSIDCWKQNSDLRPHRFVSTERKKLAKIAGVQKKKKRIEARSLRIIKSAPKPSIAARESTSSWYLIKGARYLSETVGMLTSILRKPPHSKYFKTVYNYVDFDRFVAAYRIVILFLLVELRSCKLNSFFFFLS